MPRKVLVVEDNWAIANVLKEFLQLEGYEVDVCNSPRDAISIVQKFSYRTIITDYEMPELTGIDFLESILEDGKTPERVIVFSGRDVADIPLFRLSKFGIRIWFIQKPFMHRLLEVLQESPTGKLEV